MNTESKPHVAKNVPVEKLPGGTLKHKRDNLPPTIVTDTRVIHIAGFSVTLPHTVILPWFNSHAFSMRIEKLNLIPLKVIRNHLEAGGHIVGRALAEYNMHKLEEEYARNKRIIRRAQQANRFIREMWYQSKQTGEVDWENL